MPEQKILDGEQRRVQSNLKGVFGRLMEVDQTLLAAQIIDLSARIRLVRRHPAMIVIDHGRAERRIMDAPQDCKPMLRYVERGLLYKIRSVGRRNLLRGIRLIYPQTLQNHLPQKPVRV